MLNPGNLSQSLLMLGPTKENISLKEGGTRLNSSLSRRGQGLPNKYYGV